MLKKRVAKRTGSRLNFIFFVICVPPPPVWAHFYHFYVSIVFLHCFLSPLYFFTVCCLYCNSSLLYVSIVFLHYFMSLLYFFTVLCLYCISSLFSVSVVFLHCFRWSHRMKPHRMIPQLSLESPHDTTGFVGVTA